MYQHIAKSLVTGGLISNMLVGFTALIGIIDPLGAAFVFLDRM
ncbi:hypothetical protein PQQ84_23970 [Paraburkholderia strydomiana]